MTQVFSVQDRTGTVTQLTLWDVPHHAVEVNDTGTYMGVQPWNGKEVTLAFTVCQVLDPLNFSITTQLPFGAGPGAVLQSGWPPDGVIQWLTGLNSQGSPNESEVREINPANAYITTDFLATYNNSRGAFVYADSPIEQVMQGIVQASEYIDQRYRFKGVKLLQFLSNPDFDPLIMYIDPWLAPFGFSGPFELGNRGGLFVPSTTDQFTQWPRQGCVDFNGDTVYGVPRIIQEATAEIALRALNGTALQPDYDPNIVSQGGVVQSKTSQVGPIRTQITYDTKLGIGFFADFPKVTRMLAKAGVLIAGSGLSIIR